MDQDAINRDGEALDAIAKLIGDASRIAAKLAPNDLIDADELKELRDRLSDAEGELEGIQQGVNEQRIWLCTGPGCERLDWRLRAELNASQWSEHGGWCEKCADKEYAAARRHEREESYR